jgi:hypothetical protein
MALTNKEKNEKYPVARFRLNPKTVENLADLKANSESDSWNSFFVEMISYYKRQRQSKK